MSDDLKNFIRQADKKSPFITFSDDVPVKGIYRGCKEVDNPFRPGEKTLQYTLEIEGVEKTFKSSSTRLAREIFKIKEGDSVTISRKGESFKTRWTVGSYDANRLTEEDYGDKTIEEVDKILEGEQTRKN